MVEYNARQLAAAISYHFSNSGSLLASTENLIKSHGFCY